jgi:hypothetical protein
MRGDALKRQPKIPSPIRCPSRREAIIVSAQSGRALTQRLAMEMSDWMASYIRIAIFGVVEASERGNLTGGV